MTYVRTSVLLWIVGALVILAGFFMALSANMNREHLYTVIADYSACVAAGYPVVQTNPQQCQTPDGRVFVNESQEIGTTSPSLPEATTSRAVADKGCRIAGCSSQLCVSENAQDVVSTCEYRAEYGCYKNATCEKQSNGKCGWTQTAKLKACLNSAKNPAPASSVH